MNRRRLFKACIFFVAFPEAALRVRAARNENRPVLAFSTFVTQCWTKRGAKIWNEPQFLHLYYQVVLWWTDNLSTVSSCTEIPARRGEADKKKDIKCFVLICRLIVMLQESFGLCPRFNIDSSWWFLVLVDVFLLYYIAYLNVYICNPSRCLLITNTDSFL